MTEDTNEKWATLGKALSESFENAARAFAEFFEAFNKKENK